MKALIALTVLLAAQAHAAKLIGGTYDRKAGVARLTIATKEKCTRPRYEIVDALRTCAKRTDGPCYLTLKETSILRIYCGGKYEVTTLTVDMPELPTDLTYILEGDEGGEVILQKSKLFERETGNQPSPRILEGRLDFETKKAHFVLEIENACNQPRFQLVSDFCNKRIDGPCHYRLEQTIQNRMACPRKKTLVHRVVDAPPAMLSPRLTIVVTFGESSYVLQQSDFWKR